MKLATAPDQGPRRTTLAFTGLLALVAIVVVAAAGRAPATGEKVPSSSSQTLIADYVSTLLVLIMPLGALLLVWMMFMRRGEIAMGKVKKGSRLNYLIVLVLVLGLVALKASHPNWHLGSKGQKETPSLPSLSTARGQHEQKPPHQAKSQWSLVFIFGSLALGVGISAGVLAVRRRRGTLDVRPTMEAALSEALAEGIDDLRNEADPRKAVIRTYARMERIFAARGAPKEPFEAPLEYLGRALGIVQASAHSAARVTKLFERARFSTHGVDERMKDDAIGALVALRAELEAAR